MNNNYTVLSERSNKNGLHFYNVYYCKTVIMAAKFTVATARKRVRDQQERRRRAHVEKSVKNTISLLESHVHHEFEQNMNVKKFTVNTYFYIEFGADPNEIFTKVCSNFGKDFRLDLIKAYGSQGYIIELTMNE